MGQSNKNVTSTKRIPTSVMEFPIFSVQILNLYWWGVGGQQPTDSIFEIVK